MNRRSDQPMTPDAQALNEYMDRAARNPGSPPPPPADELQAFSAMLLGAVPEVTPESLATDPILAKLLAAQQEYIAAQAPAPAQPGDKRLRRMTTESRRAVAWARSDQSDSSPVATLHDLDTGRGLPAFSHLATFVLLCLVALTLFAISISSDIGGKPAGSGDSDRTGPATGTIGISSQKPSIVVDGMQIQILDHETRLSIDSGDAVETPFRGSFLVLELVVATSDGEPLPVPFYGLLIKDDQGNIYTVDLPATAVNQANQGGVAVINGDLVGAEPNVVYLVFDVPATSTNYQLTNIEQTFTLPLD